MRNFKKKILFFLLGSFLFACGQRSKKSKVADLLNDFLLSLAPSSFKLVKKTDDFYSLELSFKEEFKPELHRKLKSIGCLGDVLIFQKHNETSQTYEDLNEGCQSLPLNDLVINPEATDKEGKKIFSYSLSLNKNDPSYSEALKTFEASPLNPKNYDEAYQLIFDLKKLVAGTTHDVEEINQLELVAQFRTLPKMESSASEARTLHLLFKKHENAKAFAEKIKLLAADELLNCEPEATVQALDKEGGCLSEVQILATLDHPSEGKKLSLQESSDLYIHQLNFNHRQDSDALQFSISQDYLVEWDESFAGLVTPTPAAGADEGSRRSQCILRGRPEDASRWGTRRTRRCPVAAGARGRRCQPCIWCGRTDGRPLVDAAWRPCGGECPGRPLLRPPGPGRCGACANHCRPLCARYVFSPGSA